MIVILTEEEITIILGLKEEKTTDMSQGKSSEKREAHQ